ncbi:DUF4129 domain-containing protein [Mycolicibacterium sp. CR10]|uniref:DUF4129 domain-containing protein n=1 Tax=Mycolicibacterium sp. CR10 TaxID=2562314 RepID=UPI0010BFDEC2|nr:DUF4129 domain-containing protein [Mycolicibacterium sp. CR10]
MPGDEKAVARAVGVIVLVALALVALRGYLPGAEPEPREPATRGSGSYVAVAAMLAVSVTVIAIAVIAQARRRSAPPPREPPREYRGERVEVPWRLLVIAAAVLLTWLLVVLLLMRWGAHLGVDDATTLTDPQPSTPQGGGESEPPPPEAPTGGGDTFGYLAAATTVLILLAVAATVIGRTRVSGPAAVAVRAGTPDPAPPSGPDLARATELGLAEIGDRSRDPREAIIACYAAMERELEKSPGTVPQDSDTPSEVLARAALRSGSATELVDLFEEARFSRHVMNEGHREDAVRALRLVQSELQGAT